MLFLQLIRRMTEARAEDDYSQRNIIWICFRQNTTPLTLLHICELHINLTIYQWKNSVRGEQIVWLAKLDTFSHALHCLYVILKTQ